MKGAEAEVVSRLLQEVQRLLKSRREEFLAERGIPFTTVTILRELGEAPGLILSELARRIGHSKGYVSVQVDQLERDGLIRKRPDSADQRRTRLELTEDGLRLRASLQRSYRRFLRKVLTTVPSSEVDAIIDGLQHLRDALIREDELLAPK